MNVVVLIDGREAIPVRAIPLLTDWMVLSPDQVVRILAGDDLHWQAFEGFAAYCLRPDGGTEQISPRRWKSWFVGKLQATSDAIKAQQISHETGYQQWRCESLAQLPAGVFVWRDEFEASYVREYGPDSLRAYMNRETFKPSDYALDFNPQPPTDIAPPLLVLEGFTPSENESRKAAQQMLLNVPRAEPLQAATGADSLASIQMAPEPERRLARLRDLGGNAARKNGEWKFTGIAALAAKEKEEGRKRNDAKTIRGDLKEAAQNELEARRAGFGNGLGQR